MKWLYIFLVVCVHTISVTGQSGVPQKSPKAYVDYKVGLTEVSVQYSSPAVRGRTIWGGIVPYNKVWRAGANHSTIVSFSTPVVIGGKQLPPGDYAFFLIPRATGRWTAIFNEDEDQWGAFLYDQQLDAVRMEVRAEEIASSSERLRYHIEDFSLEEGAIILTWEKKQVIIPFYVNALAPALANYDTLIMNMEESERWYFLAEAADMLHDFGRHAEARAKLDESLRGGEHVWNLWKKARFEAAEGNYEEAYQSVGNLKTLAASGDEQERQAYANLETEINESMQNWKASQNRLVELNRDIWIPFSEAYAANDADKYLALHSKELVRASKKGEHATDLHGYSQNVLRSFNRNAINGGKATIEFRFTERFASDVSASEKGIYKYTYFSPAGSATSGYGKFHVVSRKENGKWKIFMDYDSDENGSIDDTDYEAAYAVHDIRQFD